MKNRTYITQEQANAFFDNLYKEGKNKESFYTILADGFGINLRQAQELFYNWADSKSNSQNSGKEP